MRTRIKDEILAEVGLAPKPNGKLAIILSGMPSSPQQNGTIRFLMKHGYHAIYPRYRGTWESFGNFLAVSPEQDVLDVLDALSGEFVSAWDGEVFRIDYREIILICSSFGGPAGLLAARDPRVSKVVAFSPVVDWNAESPGEPFEQFARFIDEGFGAAFRIPQGNLEKLKTGTFYTPQGHEQEIPGEKILIIHAQDDEVVLPGPVERFAENTRARLIMLKKGGHLGLGRIRTWRLWRKIKRFLKN